MLLDNRFLHSQIDEAYSNSGNVLGWRLLAGPKQTLNSADIAFIGLNPGGTIEPKEQPRFSNELGSSYVVERWGSAKEGQNRLQKQVVSLFTKLDTPAESVLAGNLIPFRSRSFKELIKADEALEFGVSIWRQIIRQARPTLIIAMGSKVEQALSKMLDAKFDFDHSLNWGKVKGRRSQFEGGLLIGLPHLSRYGVVTRPESQDGLVKLFGSRWQA